MPAREIKRPRLTAPLSDTAAGKERGNSQETAFRETTSSNYVAQNMVRRARTNPATLSPADLLVIFEADEEERRHGLYQEEKYRSITIQDHAKLLPGDWVYFRNRKDNLEKNSGGFWLGEHALYMGNNTYQGFGSGRLRYEQMIIKLKEAYIGLKQFSGTAMTATEIKEFKDGSPGTEYEKPGLASIVRRPQVANWKPGLPPLTDVPPPPPSPFLILLRHPPPHPVLSLRQPLFHPTHRSQSGPSLVTCIL